MGWFSQALSDSDHHRVEPTCILGSLMLLTGASRYDARVDCVCAGSPESTVFHSILYSTEYLAAFSSFIELCIQQLTGTGISLHTVSHHVLKTVRIP